MEVMPGYKQTEVGVIPEDWEVRTIQELIDGHAVVGHLDGNHGELYPRSHEFKDYGVPYITANDLRGRMVSFKQCKFLSEERARRFRKGIAKDGDVLFAHNATVGPTSLLSTNLDYVILSTTATYFRCNPEKLCNAFVLYLLQSPSFVGQYQAVMAQSTRNQIPITSQRKLSVALPPTKAEQEAIAETLSNADTLIETLEQLIAKKRLLKQGVMQELLTGKKHLRGFGGEWEKISLGELFTFKNGLNKGKEFFGYGTPIVNYMDVFENSAIYSSNLEGRVSLTKQELKTFDVKKGDVFFTRTSETPEEIGMASVILDEPNQTVFSGFVLRGRPKDERLRNEFKAYCLRSDFVRKQIISKASYTTRALTNGRILSAIVLPIPPEKEQTAIATTLSDMDAEIALLEAQLAKYRQLKEGLMHNLLTGRIRLV